MNASVITFSVQVGSQGDVAASNVAARLGFRYYDREILARAATSAGVTAEEISNAERWPGFIERMLESLGRTVAFSGEMLPPLTPPEGFTMTSSDYRSLIEAVVRDLASQGRCVLVGHAAQVLLREKTDAFKVLTWGSQEIRAKYLVSANGNTPEDALRLVEESDSRRHDLFKHAYNVEWLETSLYDLTINTDRVGAAAIADAVLRLLEAE